jgi:hypothetical protein
MVVVRGQEGMTPILLVQPRKEQSDPRLRMIRGVPVKTRPTEKQ